jgi:hypothetical protein
LWGCLGWALAELVWLVSVNLACLGQDEDSLGGVRVGLVPRAHFE